MPDFKEVDLYEPAKRIFEEMGFTVRAEVKNCDLFAVKNDVTVVAELKKSFNMTLCYQLMDRQTFANNVYAVIPRPDKGTNDKNWKNMIKLCQKLDFGLITVALDSPLKFAEVVLSPSGIHKISNKKKNTTAMKEAKKRSEDLNTGGSTGKKLVTAYRERSLEMLCLTYTAGEMTGARLKELGYDKGEYSILYKNFYKWFKKKDKGIYELSETGLKVIKDNDYGNLIEFYMEKFKELKEE